MMKLLFLNTYQVCAFVAKKSLRQLITDLIERKNTKAFQNDKTGWETQ